MADTLLKDPLPHFVKRMDDGRFCYIIDHHTISSMGCPAKFYLRHVRNLRPKGGGKFVLDIGSWWSSVMEEFYNAMAMMQALTPVQTPTKDTILSIADKVWDEMKLDELKMDPKQAKRLEAFGGKPGGLLMAAEYWDRQAVGDCLNWKVIAAEKGFGIKGEIVLYEDEKLVIWYMGKPDLGVFEKASGDLLPLDHKSVEYIERRTHLKYKPHPQTAGYIYAFNVLAQQLGIEKRVTRCIINVAARLKPTDKPRKGTLPKPRFIRVFPAYSLEEIEEWRQNVVRKVKRLHTALETNTWDWEESFCHLYGGCEYREVHNKPAGSRELIIRADFVQVEPWVPYSADEAAED